MNTIYLDYAATTPIDQRVLTAMLPSFNEHFGNPSSIHQVGQQAEAALERARHRIAEGLNAQPSEIIFTSCGSESDNLAIRGAALQAKQVRGANRLLISPLEHPAVLITAKQLASLFDFQIAWLEPDQNGVIHADSVAKEIDDRTAIVSVMHANNEIGTLNPLTEIGTVCQDYQVPFHTDAVQGGAHFALDVTELNVDLLSLGAHKFYGPKGVGVLFLREGVDLIPIQTGGSQEGGLRAATENVPLIIGMAEAFMLLQQEHQKRINHVVPLRNQIIDTVLNSIPNSILTGHPQERLPNHASFIFEGADGNLLVSLLDAKGFACSSGSACKTGSPSPSSVLLALGYSEVQAMGSLRVSVGKDTQAVEVDAFLSILPECVRQARNLS